MPRRRLGLSVFWRTFAWLTLLLASVGLVWQLSFRHLEAEPRALQAAAQLGDLVMLSRAALSDEAARRRSSPRSSPS